MKLNITELKNEKNSEKVFNIENNIEINNEPVKYKAKLIGKLYENTLKISGIIEGKTKIECNRCLKEKEYNFNWELEEYFLLDSLSDKYPEEFELKEGYFPEDLNGKNEIDLNDLIYQFITVNLPNDFVCDINCIENNEEIKKYMKKVEKEDPRLEIFKKIEIQEEKK